MQDVVGSLDQQLRAHFPFLVQAFREGVGTGRRFKNWIRGQAPKEAVQIGKEGGLEAFSAALDAFGIALPGAGYALTTSVRAGREFRPPPRRCAAGPRGRGSAG